MRLQRQNHPLFLEIAEWLADPVNDVRLLSTDVDTVGTTGTKIVSMSPETAHALRLEFPELAVLRNRPVGLIRPLVDDDGGRSAPPDDPWHLEAIGLLNARRAGFAGQGQGVTVAVLDTGVDATHPELAHGVTGSAMAVDMASRGVVAVAPSLDTEGHGTHVAGLICGRRVGVAPAALVRNVIVIPEGRGSTAHFVLALAWAASQPDVQIINLSAGIPGFVDGGMRDAIRDVVALGVFPVVAIGNEGRNNTRSPGNYVESFAVGATTEGGAVAGFSGGGRLVVDHHQYDAPDVVAPGAAISSSVRGGGYESWNGTSMATPIVSGLAALALERYPTLSVHDLRDCIFISCKDLRLPADRQGSGQIDISAVFP